MRMGNSITWLEILAREAFQLPLQICGFVSGRNKRNVYYEYQMFSDFLQLGTPSTVFFFFYFYFKTAPLVKIYFMNLIHIFKY